MCDKYSRRDRPSWALRKVGNQRTKRDAGQRELSSWFFYWRRRAPRPGLCSGKWASSGRVRRPPSAFLARTLASRNRFLFLCCAVLRCAATPTPPDQATAAACVTRPTRKHAAQLNRAPYAPREGKMACHISNARFGISQFTRLINAPGLLNAPLFAGFTMDDRYSCGVRLRDLR